MNLIILKGTNDSISSSQETPDSPWCDVAVETHKISPLDTLNQALVRGKELVTMYMIP